MGGLAGKWGDVKKRFTQEHDSSVIKIIRLHFSLFISALTSSPPMFFSLLFSLMPQPPSRLCSLKPLLNNIQSGFCICFWTQPVGPHCKVAISFPEKWHNCRVLLFGSASCHYTEKRDDTPSRPAVSSLSLKSFQKGHLPSPQPSRRSDRRPCIS